MCIRARGDPVMLIDSQGTQPDAPVNLPPDTPQDSEGNYLIPDEYIYVEGKAPPMDPYERSRRGGTTNIQSLDEFERIRNYYLTNSTAYKTWWPGNSAADYWREFPEEASREYYGQLNAEYKSYRQDKGVELEAGWHTMRSCFGLVQVIGGVTVVVAGGFAIATAAGPASVVGGGLELGGGG